MNIVIDIQGFRDVEENFIPKEVTVLAINAAITGHWIMTPPCPFEDLPVRARRENNWLTKLSWNRMVRWRRQSKKLYNTSVRHYTTRTLHVYQRTREGSLSESNLLSRNVYNLEGISPAFKNLPDFEALYATLTN